MLTGAGANFGLIAIQRSAGRMASEPTELKRIFSWLGLAPALANVVGPVLAGTLIDLGGFRLAFAVLAALPLAEPGLGPPGPASRRAPTLRRRAKRGNALEPAAAPGFTRLLLVNWLLSSSWDVHTLPGADPRPRARLQRLGDRPRARRLRDRGGGGAAGRFRSSPIACAKRKVLVGAMLDRAAPSSPSIRSRTRPG